MELLWLLSTIQWIDLLDIALLSYLVYRALLIIHGTRALQSLAGLLFLLLLYAGSGTLGLTGVYWLLDKFFVYLVLAIIILFQEDIRKGLARAGQFLPNNQVSQEVSTIENVVKTVAALASRRIGALIIFERDGVGVQKDILQTGTQMDALISSELLMAIFLPTSPLHDGAVILRKERVIASQCILPMTTQTLSKIHGTRHRAGVGITEKSDAIALIISEERGTISIAENGNLELITNNNELRQRLQELMAVDSGVSE